MDVRAKIQRYTYDPTSERLREPVDLIAGLPAHDDHLGGRLVIGDDRTLYFSIGDQGGNWQRNRCNPILSQVLPTADDIATRDWTRYQGKILRLSLDGSIPDDNPVIEGGAQPRLLVRTPESSGPGPRRGWNAVRRRARAEHR